MKPFSARELLARVKLLLEMRSLRQDKELMRKKDQFMSLASHELKTPLTTVKTSLQIIDRMLRDHSYDKVKDFVHKAVLHVNKLTKVVNDLLDISRIQSGRLRFNYSDFLVDEIVEACIDRVQNQSNNHKIIVEGDSTIQLTGDKVRLEQVLCNLLTNAVRYSPQADKVVLNISKEGELLKITVKDFGIGISKEKLPLVFDRFFRVEETSQQFQGLGLGLYISKEIIKRLGGEMQAESKEGEGSTFCFMIPVKPSPSQQDQVNS